MKPFMDKNFLLHNTTAQVLYHSCAAEMPIFDYHCHLSAKEIWQDSRFENITQIWLNGDHYKWRQMRIAGVPEKFCTGDGSDYDKFTHWAATIEDCIGNPLYHWTHLELSRYFGIDTPLSKKTAGKIWEQTNRIIASDDFSVRKLLEKSNVYALFTTDDPVDTLEYHKLLAGDDTIKTKVLPAFRPDKALNIGAQGFGDYIKTLEQASGVKINTSGALKTALAKRLDHFSAHGCLASDHGLTYIPYAPATAEQVDQIFKKVMDGQAISTPESDQYITDILLFLGKEYHRRGFAMELHLLAMRNNSKKMFNALGPDVGGDSIGDRNIGLGLSGFLGHLEQENALPKTIIYTLNPAYNYVIGTLLGCFSSNSSRGKIQFGTAWWFNDHKEGMIEHLKAYGNLSLLPTFIGMLTDSRSFLSYPRHEYFRRILCNFIGQLVEEGEYPDDFDKLASIVKDISFNNAATYFFG